MHRPVAPVLAMVALVGLSPITGAQLPAITVQASVGDNLVDAARTIVRLWMPANQPLKFTCDPVALERGHRYVELTARVTNRNDLVGCPTTELKVIDLGHLPPGTYRVDATVVRRSDGSSAGNQSLDFDVAARGTKCNVNPRVYAARLLFDSAGEADGFMQGKGSDATWLASHGNLHLERAFDYFGSPSIRATFAPLADPIVIVDRLRADPDIRGVAYQPYSLRLCFPGLPCPGPDEHADLVEYRATFREQYFYTLDADEQAALDTGTIAGWQRTGESIRVARQTWAGATIENRVHRVYRFWGGSTQAAPAHFFTLSQDECAVLRDRPEWHWTFEDVPFWAYALKDGACTNGVPLRRLYNAGAGGAPAHRYATSAAVVGEMTGRGWVDEGAVMCVAGPS